LHLASRQWDHFVNTLLTYLSWEGVASGAIALGMVKIAHELGHAYAAASLGCRVHSMGLAFVVMAPMPYTDVTDAWRLTDRRKRLLIDSAGMVAEAAIAAVALIAWAFLPDGPLRSAAFVLSVVSIASSLAINLNPFMRFDGYYLLSEALGVANLQSRAFAIGRWQLREWLFGLGDPAPEEMPTHRRTWLALYAWATWIYRLFLFLGIALLVYHYFFKALGLILFAVEIVYFIARPIGGELSAWWQMRSRLWTSPRARLTCAAAMIAVLLGCIPLSTTVEIPAVLEFTRLQSIYPTRNAQVVAVHVRHGQAVRAGARIATLASAEIVDERTRAQISLQIAELQFGRRLADAADREGSLIIESRIEAARTQIAGLDREQSELEIVAPFDGRIAELNPEIHPGRWVSPRDLIAIVTDGRSLSAKGYVAEADVGRIRPGARARFIPEHPGRERVELEIERISQAGVAQIEIADLASINSGRVAVSLDDRRRLIPASAQYMVSMITTEVSTNGDLAIRGLVHAEGRPESVFARVWRRALGVLVRESGA
jgi:putative peptide zinc metalloprotease protein